MLDPRLLKDNPDMIRDMLMKRGIDFPLDELLEIDKRRRSLIVESQRLKHEKNVVAERIANLKKSKKDASKEIEQMRIISRRIEEIDKELIQVNARFRELMLALPNLLHESVPYGKDESDNIVVRSWGDPIKKDMDHISIASKFDLLDLERAAKISGSRFYILKNALVRLTYALISFALDFISKKGFVILQPPYMINRKAMEGAIILDDFEDVIYKVQDEDLYLIGTSEHAIASMHMDEIIIDDDILPLRYAGVSACFRKEAGAHGRDTKGIFRVHQFEKVEQFVFAKPDQSWDEHEYMLKNAEEFFQLLGLPYRIVLLCSGDLGKVAAKTYDLEGWFAGQGRYRELVSCSNCLDYQARRLKIRYKDKPNEESRYIHTLNSTLVATERTLAALLEYYQEHDRIIIPKVLRDYMNMDYIAIPKG